MKTYLSHFRSLTLAALVASAVAVRSQDAVIPFQDQLANQAGQPLSPTNAVTLVFRVYSAPVGGMAIWEESQPGLSVNAGRFSVLLGSRTMLPAQSYFNSTLYLGITVDDGNPATADVEMRSRQAIVPVISARYAQNADKLRGYDWSALFGTNNPVDGKIPGSKIANDSVTGAQIATDGVGTNELQNSAVISAKIRDAAVVEAKLAPGLFVPVGGIVMWWGTRSSIPPNFELCDGNSPTTSGATLSGGKPNLIDRFPKGATAAATDVRGSVSGGTNTIAQRNTGGTALTVAQMPAHTHTLSTMPGYDAAGGYSGGGWGGDAFLQTTSSTGGSTAHDHTIAAHDNRPAFLELFFIIRVK